MRISNPTTSLENSIYQTRIFWEETYAEHKKHCEFGCALCAAVRRREQMLLKEKKKSVVGISGDQVLAMREAFKRQDKIQSLFKNKGDIYDRYGAIDVDVYEVLKQYGYSDSQIRKYFGINNHVWQKFKATNYPADSKQAKDLSVGSVKAIKDFKKSHVTRHNSGRQSN